MKKLTILILTGLFCFGLFAEPKIPKTDNYRKSLESDFTGENYLCSVNSSGTNFYKIFSVIEKDYNRYTLYFSNTSLITNIEIALSMSFPTERDLDNYCSDIDTSDLENVFQTIHKSLINYNITPIYSTDKNNAITKILYIAHQE